MSTPTLAERAQRVRMEELRTSIATTLAAWQQQDLIAPGWWVNPDLEQSCWRVRFRISGRDTEHSLTDAEFEAYRQGFTDRRTAVMHRTPRREKRR